MIDREIKVIFKYHNIGITTGFFYSEKILNSDLNHFSLFQSLYATLQNSTVKHKPFLILKKKKIDI